MSLAGLYTKAKTVSSSGIFPYILGKGVLLGLSILAITLAAGYQSQIYVEKVFINDENPPSLFNMNAISTAFQVAFLLIVLMLLYFGKTLDIVKSSANSALAMDGFMTVLVIFLLGTVISQVMYSKKYFQYKDEGLRAIRAFKELMMYVIIIIGVIPFGIFLRGSFAAISSM